MITEEVRSILLICKSRSEASHKIFGYRNKLTLSKIDEYLKEIDFNYNKIKKLCKICNKEIKNKNKYFCSVSCSTTFNNKKRGHMSDETKTKIGNSNKITNPKKIITVKCNWCDKLFETTKRKSKKSCSVDCSINFNRNHLRKIGKIGCLKSVESQNRRSKNEIFLSELCLNEFENVRLNEQIFNGWDADIILDDYKLAIMWDGNWHHKKLSRNHSLEQVQNRDKIRIKEIIKFGYKPYTINDYGKFDKKFVEEEFEKLKLCIMAP